MVNGTLEPGSAGVLAPISADCPAALPWLGLYRGRDEVKKFRPTCTAIWKYPPSSARVISKGSKGAAFGWFRLCALATGRIADISYSICFELRDGRIVKYHLLENALDVARTLYAGGSWLIDTEGAKHHIPLSKTIGEGDGK